MADEQRELDFAVRRILTLAKSGESSVAGNVLKKCRSSPDFNDAEIPSSVKINSVHTKYELKQLIEEMSFATFIVLKHFERHIFAEKSPEMVLKEERDELKEERDELLRKSLELQEQEEKLKVECDDLLRRTVKLQEQVIELQGEQLNRVTETVQKDLRTFSAVVTQNCKTAFASKKIQKAVEKVTHKPVDTGPDRSKNLMVFGLPECEDETESVLKGEVENVFAELGEKPTIEARRVGLKRGGRERPVIVKLQSREMLLSLLQKAKQLKQLESYCGVYLARDMSFAERSERRELHQTLKELRDSNPGGQFRVRRGVIDFT